MTRIQVSLLACWLAACDQRAEPGPVWSAPATRSDTTALVVVDRPTVVGFVPPAADSAAEEEVSYTEGVSHVGFALEDARACLGGRDSAQVALVVDTAVRVRRGARTDTLRFSRVDSLSYGAYLLAPAGEPRLINVTGPSALIPAVAEAIPGYFRRPPCPER